MAQSVDCKVHQNYCKVRGKKRNKNSAKRGAADRELISSYLMHYNEDVFPSPDVLDPERWLTTDEATLGLCERQFGPFSKGARGCIGLNLAQAEVHIALAPIV
jgi:cytochrome P450